VGFIEPDHEHRETDEERERNIDPEQVVDEFGIDVTRRYSCEPIMLALSSRRGRRFVHTIVDRTNEDGSETEDDKWDKNTLYWILD